MKKEEIVCPPKKRASGLIFAIILLFVILGMVVTLSSVTVLETKMSQKTKSSVGAFYNSESGVEWALNKIASSSGAIGSVAGLNWSNSNGYASCPDALGGANTCKIYFIDKDTNKIITSGSTDVSQIAAVRSVGTQNTGDTTQRAIEAAVAAGGGGCYVDESYTSSTMPAIGSDCRVAGFKNVGDIGHWGVCFVTGGGAYYSPPDGGCSGGGQVPIGEGLVCCKP